MANDTEMLRIMLQIQVMAPSYQPNSSKITISIETTGLTITNCHVQSSSCFSDFWSSFASFGCDTQQNKTKHKTNQKAF
jgi:hypothetical protein